MNEVRIKLSVDGTAQAQGALAGTGDQLAKLNSNLLKTAQYGAGLLVVVPTLREMAAGMVKAADSVTTLNSQLQLATGSTAKAAAAYDALFAIAQRSRVSFVELGTTFASVSRAGQTLGLSQERLLTVTEAIGNAMTISGGSAAGLQAALVQLGQGLASGVLRGEELNSVMEQSPRLAKALADGLGVPLGKLRELGAQGALTAQSVISALEKSAPQLAKEVAGASLTVGQAFTVLGNSVTRFIGEADRATGASGTLAGAMRGVAGALDSVGKTIGEHQAAFAVIGGTLAGAAAVAGVVALGKGLMLAAGGVAALGTAVAALNPVTLALLGIGAAAGAAVAASNAYDKTAAGIERTITKLKAADAELAELRAALTKNPGDIVLGQYLRDLERDAPKRAEALRQLRQELALLQAGPSGSVAEDARLDRGTQALAERTQRAAALAEVIGRLSGVNVDFGKGLSALNASYEAGELSLAAYREQVALLIDKEGGGKEIATKAAAARVKAMADLEASMASARIAAAEWADAVADGQRILAEATAQTDGLSKGQQRLLEYLKSPAYAANSEEMRQIAINTLAAAISAEQFGQAQSEAAKAHAELLTALESSADTVAKQVQRLQDEEVAAGLAAAQNISLAVAIEQVTVRRLQEQQAIQMSYGDDAAVAAIQREIDKRRELAGLIAGKEAREAAAEAAKQAAKDWERSADQIGSSLTDALLRGFESGKSAAVNLRDSAVNLFKSLVLKPAIQAVVTPIAGTVSSALGFAGTANAAGNAGSVLGSAGNLAGMASMAGSLGAFGTAAGYGIHAALGGTAGTAISSGASMIGAGSVAEGAGMMAGAAGPYVLAAVAAYQVFRSLTADKNAKLGYGSTTGSRAFGFGRGTDVGAQGGLVDIARAVQTGISRSAMALGGSAAAIDVQTASDIDRKGKGSGIIGILRGGRLVNGVQTGGTDPLASAASKLGDAGKLGEWFANSTSAAIIAGLQQADLPARMRQFFGGVDAFGLSKEKADAMLAAASAAQAVSQALGGLGGVFAQLPSLSVAAVTALADVAGGVNALQQKSAAYVAQFYSQAEQQAAAWRGIGDALSAVGIGAVPATREAFRSLVDSLDLSAEAGREQFAALMNVSGAFAELVPATEAVAAAGRSAVDIATERARLETRLLELQGDTAELRRRELAALDASNRGLQEQINALTDARTAAQAAAEVTRTLTDEVERLRGVAAADTAERSGADLLAQFSILTAQARAGNADAAQRLPGLSAAIEQSARSGAATSLDLIGVRAWLAQSLTTTAGGGGAVDEVRLLREDSRAIGAAMASALNRLLKVVERWDIDGQPETRTY